MRRKRSRASDSQDKVTIELRDYSLVDGEFDKIASVGMFEHVGVANYPRVLPDHPPPAEAGRALPSSLDRVALGRVRAQEETRKRRPR